MSSLHPTIAIAPSRASSPATSPVSRVSSALSANTLAAIDDMLGRLDTVTRAGQQHLMTKIILALSAHPLVASRHQAARRLAELRREATKSAPDDRAFTLATRALVASIAPVYAGE
jgi:hypothetical protein